jgi:hypothetical protein
MTYPSNTTLLTRAPHWFRIAIRPHGDVMHAIAHIDPRYMEMDHFQPRVLRLQPPCPFLLLLPVLPQLLICHHQAPQGKRILFGPVTIGLEISPTGSKGHLR